MKRHIALMVERLLGDPSNWLVNNRLFWWAIETAYPDPSPEEMEGRRIDRGRIEVELTARALRRDPHQEQVLVESVQQAENVYSFRYAGATQLAADLEAWLQAVDPDGKDERNALRRMLGYEEAA